MLLWKLRDRLQISLVTLSELINFFPPEIIRKPKVFWWFHGKEKSINSLKFAKYYAQNLVTISNTCRDCLQISLEIWANQFFSILSAFFKRNLEKISNLFDLSHDLIFSYKKSWFQKFFTFFRDSRRISLLT